MLSRAERRTGAACGVVGSVALFIGTYLHPMQADPNRPLEAFAEYAADGFWVASHLIQLAGVALIVAALLLIARQLEMRDRAGWARIASGGAVASLAIAAALQAVDGIALKHMVDAWARAPASEKDMVFHAAFAVRQMEVGLASMFSLLMGLTAVVYGAALLAGRLYPRWLNGLALIGGATTASAGLAMAYSGFSELSMALSMPGSFILLVWMVAIGVWMWRDRAAP